MLSDSAQYSPAQISKEITVFFLVNSVTRTAPLSENLQWLSCLPLLPERSLNFSSLPGKLPAKPKVWLSEPVQGQRCP